MRIEPRSSQLPAPREVLASRLKEQAVSCALGGSPFYSSLLEAAAVDVEAGGPVWDVLDGYEAEHQWAALALRLMGAIHRLVLNETLPELASHYPSVGGDGDSRAAWPLFRQALIDHRAEIGRLVSRGCQTNEVGRCAALLGGFLEVAHRTGLPLRILELGASAGLNLRWDCYRYESTHGEWGDVNSPVRFDHAFDLPPALNRSAEVIERKGCDLSPVDPTTEEGALKLRSFIWADQLGRLSLLDGAIKVAQEVPADVERNDAASFLERVLAEPRPDTATVVYHSVVMQYVDSEGRERIKRAIANAPVHHLAMEPVAMSFEVRLDGELLGTSGPHGTHVRWLQ
jgi:hypothetical protein